MRTTLGRLRSRDMSAFCEGKSLLLISRWQFEMMGSNMGEIQLSKAFYFRSLTSDAHHRRSKFAHATTIIPSLTSISLIQTRKIAARHVDVICCDSLRRLSANEGCSQVISHGDVLISLLSVKSKQKIFCLSYNLRTISDTRRMPSSRDFDPGYLVKESMELPVPNESRERAWTENEERIVLRK